MKSTKRSLMTSLVALLLCFSMLLGTTYAWFTDSAMSGSNIIQSGNLDVEMYYSETWLDAGSNAWKDADGKPIFTYDNWEPGYTDVKYVKVKNAGDLAFKWMLSIKAEDEMTDLADVIDVYYVNPATEAVTSIANKSSIGVLSDVVKMNKSMSGVLLPSSENSTLYTVGETVLAIALHMQEEAGNEYQGVDLGDFSISLIATQFSYESDAFNNEYDKDAEWPNNVIVGGNSATAPVVPTADNKVSSAVSLLSTNSVISASVPAGVKLNAGVDKLTLRVNDVADSKANIALSQTEASLSIDVHIDGVATDNDVVMAIGIKELLPVGLNMGNYRFYHVENGATVEMTLLADGATPVHNNYEYDPATGDVVLHLKSFSEVALVADTENAWGGEFDYTWYDASKTDLTIANADQLAAFGAIVGGMAEGIERDSFAGKTVKLLSDINLGDNESENNPDLIFYPIGYYNSTGSYEKTIGGSITSSVSSFEGTFDGNGNTIAYFYQNTWEMFGDYNDGYSGTPNHYKDAMGLFGYVVNGTVKNLTVSNFSSDGEYTPTGVIAAYADGDSTFENIAITNCNPRVYNTGNGGIIGIAGDTSAANDDHITLKNITVDNSNKISALWGSWDVACGGLVGMYRGNVDGSGNATGDTISFENCHVAAQIDVYNDVCANYQYYAYRYSGMIIGSVRHNTKNTEGKTIPNMTGISATGCTVNYGDWNDYYYCEFEKNTMASYSEDYQFSRVPHSELNFTDSNGNGVVDADERASVTGCTHTHTAEENHQAIYLPFHQLFTGYSWGVSSIGLEKYSGIVTNLDITEGDQEESVEKFEGKVTTLVNNKTFNLGDIFTFVNNGVDPVPVALTVTVTNLDENNPVSATIVYDRTTWDNSTITFAGVGNIKITIQDYFFCTPTTIDVIITERQPEEKFETKFTNDYLYRVGNQNNISLGSLFKEKENVDVGEVSVTIETLAGNASGNSLTETQSPWTTETIGFTGTGIVKVTITDNDYCIPTELTLEVVDAVNATGAMSATENNVVLLNDISSGFTVSGNYTVFGNGFTLTYTGNGQYLNNGLRQGIVNVSENGRLDNLRIEASIYPVSYLYYDEVKNGPSTVDGDRTRYHYQLSAVAAKDRATISNCYIYGGRNNIFVNTGNVTITDTVTECGTLANIQIQSTNESTVTLNNVTTIQHKVNATIVDTTAVMLGAGVIVGPDTDTNPTIVLNGDFKQYNWVTSADKDDVTNSTAKSIIQTALDATAFNHTVNDKTAVNLGIIYLNAKAATVTNNTGLPYEFGSVTMMDQDGKVYSLQNATESQIYSDYANADKSTVNGDYLPTFEFDLGDQEISYDGSEDTRYLYGDANGVTALYKDGEDPLTLDLTKLATVYKYEGIPYAVTVVCKDSSGNALAQNNGVVTLDAKDGYTIVFTVIDNIFYDKNGQTITKSVTREYSVPLNLTVKAADIKNATVSITKTALDGVYTTVNLTDYKLRINFLDCISITDYNNKGTGTTVDLTSNISSATITPSNVNVFTTASTVTVTYTDGRVLTVNLSKISGSSPGTKTAIVNTSGGLYFITEGALNDKPTEAANQNTCTITSVSYKGNSGSVVTDDTDVKVTWALGSSSGGGCVTPDTLITLADGTQVRVDSLTGNEELLVWNMETGMLDKAPIMFVDSDVEAEYEIIKLKFSDGTEVKVIYEHGFWDYDLNKYVYLDRNAADYIGHIFAKQNGDALEKVQLVDVVIETETTTAWSPVTAGHLCYFVNGMLSMPGGVGGLFNIFEVDAETMTYDYEAMQRDIETYGLYTYEELNAICPLSEDMFNAAGGAYLKISIGKGNLTEEELFAMINRYSKFFE